MSEPSLLLTFRGAIDRLVINVGAMDSQRGVLLSFRSAGWPCSPGLLGL